MCTRTRKVRNTRASGRRTSNTVKAMKLGLKEPATKVSTTWARKRAAASTSGQTAQPTRANGRITRSKDMVSTIGLMVDNTMVSGALTICLDLESTFTLTALDTTVSMSTTKKMVSVITFGPMAESMKAGGTKASNMALVSITTLSKRLIGSAFGKTENVLNGLIKTTLYESPTSNLITLVTLQRIQARKV